MLIHVSFLSMNLLIKKEHSAGSDQKLVSLTQVSEEAVKKRSRINNDYTEDKKDLKSHVKIRKTHYTV